MSLVLPFRLAFVEATEYRDGWYWFYVFVDVCYLADIILNFFTSI